MSEIKLDGSYGEGGGQIVRTALALSTLLGKGVSVDQIRKGRARPGLKAQHVHCVRALEKICGAQTEGVELGSEWVRYSPGVISAKTVSVDIETAGSISLLLQGLLLPSCFADGKVRLKIRGGTDVLGSPTYDYFVQFILPQYRRFADIECKLLRRGFYPQGGGQVEVKIRPRIKRGDFSDAGQFLCALREKCEAVNLSERGALKGIRGISISSAELRRREVSERQARGAKYALQHLGLPIRISQEYVESDCIGTVICLWAVGEEKDKGKAVACLGADALGEKGKPAEEVGEQAGLKLLKEIESGAAIDAHLADNLIPILGLCRGEIGLSDISPHTHTNIHTVSEFLGHGFECEGGRIRVLK